MKKTLLISLLVISAATIIHLASRASAQPKNAAPKWEYCAITHLYATESFNKALGFAQISYFDQSDYRETWSKHEGETINPANHAQAEQAYQRARESSLQRHCHAGQSRVGNGWRDAIGQTDFGKRAGRRVNVQARHRDLFQEAKTVILEQ